MSRIIYNESVEPVHSTGQNDSFTNLNEAVRAVLSYLILLFWFIHVFIYLFFTWLYYVITRTTHVIIIIIYFSAETSVLFKAWCRCVLNRFFETNHSKEPIQEKIRTSHHKKTASHLQQRWIQMVPGSSSSYFAFCLTKHYSLSTWH